jgi:HK97 family phage major capsid protein
MNISDITYKMNNLANTWEEFKSTNDERLSLLERNRNIDPLITDKLDRLSNSLDECKGRLNQMETANYRSNLTSISSHPDHNDEHKQALFEYLRKGNEDGLNKLQRTYGLTSIPDEGGYLITPQLSSNIARSIVEISPMRQLASIETITTDALDVIADHNQAAAGWINETGPVENTETPKIDKIKIPVHELYAQPKATQKLIDDSHINIENWLSEKLVTIFSQMENSAFINGDGIGKPRGILNYAAGASANKIEHVTTKENKISTDDIIDLFYSLKDHYATHATFLMNRMTLRNIRVCRHEIFAHRSIALM